MHGVPGYCRFVGLLESKCTPAPGAAAAPLRPLLLFHLHLHEGTRGLPRQGPRPQAQALGRVLASGLEAQALGLDQDLAQAYQQQA